MQSLPGPQWRIQLFSNGTVSKSKNMVGTKNIYLIVFPCTCDMHINCNTDYWDHGCHGDSPFIAK